MTSKERAELRAKANPLEPIFQIGKEGISENLIAQLDDALDARELLKVRIHLETAPMKPREFAAELSEALGAEIIQVIGGIIVIYRKADKEKIALKKQKRLKAAGTKQKKKAVKIKGLRQRQKEYDRARPKPKPKFTRGAKNGGGARNGSKNSSRGGSR